VFNVVDTVHAERLLAGLEATVDFSLQYPKHGLVPGRTLKVIQYAFCVNFWYQKLVGFQLFDQLSETR
jgi:hypothetical protein